MDKHLIMVHAREVEKFLEMMTTAVEVDDIRLAQEALTNAESQLAAIRGMLEAADNDD